MSHLRLDVLFFLQDFQPRFYTHFFSPYAPSKPFPFHTPWFVHPKIIFGEECKLWSFSFCRVYVENSDVVYIIASSRSMLACSLPFSFFQTSNRKSEFGCVYEKCARAMFLILFAYFTGFDNYLLRLAGHLKLFIVRDIQCINVLPLRKRISFHYKAYFLFTVFRTVE